MRGIKLQSADGCRQALERITKDVLNGKLEPKVGNAATYTISIALQSLRVDETERRLADAEKLLQDLETRQGGNYHGHDEKPDREASETC